MLALRLCKRRVAVVGSVLTLAITLALVSRSHSGGLRYEGQTVEQWLRSPDWTDHRHRVEFAISYLGEDAIAPLTRLLTMSGSHTENWILRHSVTRFFYQIFRPFRPGQITRWELRERALTSLEMLGSRARGTTSALLRCANNTREEPTFRVRALNLSARYAANDPRVVRALENLKSDPDVGRWAIRILENLHRDAQKQREQQTERLLRQQFTLNVPPPALPSALGFAPEMSLRTDRPASISDSGQSSSQESGFQTDRLTGTTNAQRSEDR
jgi:hypothetical protein